MCSERNMSSRLPIINNFRKRWNIETQIAKPTPKPVILPKTIPAPAVVPVTQSPIFTVGAEHDPGIYGALSLSPARVREVMAEAKAAETLHEKEVSVPIETYKGPGSPAGGVGLVDFNFRQKILNWEAQRVLFAPFKTGEVQSTSPIKTYRN